MQQHHKFVPTPQAKFAPSIVHKFRNRISEHKVYASFCVYAAHASVINNKGGSVSKIMNCDKIHTPIMYKEVEGLCDDVKTEIDA